MPRVSLAAISPHVYLETCHTRSVDISFDKNVDTANTIKFNFFILVVPPISELD